jgi:hypothetical protein
VFVDASGNVGVGVVPSAQYSTVKALQVGALGATIIAGNTSAGGTSAFGQNYYTDPTTATYKYAASSYPATAYHQYNGEHRWFNAPSGTAGNTFTFTQAMTLDASGRLGLGTISPTAILHAVASSSSGTTNADGIRINAAGNVAINMGANSSVGYGWIQSANWGSGYIATAINPNGGNVGIGTTSPGSALEVNAAAATSPFIAKINTTEAARIDSSGRLLVGTSSARSLFFAGGASALTQIEGNSTATASLSITRNDATADGNALILAKARSTAYAIVQYVNGTTSDDKIGRISFQGADGTNLVPAAMIECYVDATPGANDMPGRLVFSTTLDGASSPTERMRITNTGSVTINGATSASGGTHTIQDSGSSPNTLRLYNNTDSNNTTNRFLICDAAASVLRAEIRSNGGLANYSANNANLSDRNVKKDISRAADTWSCVKEWEIVNYRYKDQPDNTDLNLGVIAQQVAESCPEVIIVFQKAREATEDAPAQEERLGVKEQQMYWMAIKALQEAMDRIETLEASNADMLARLTALEAA